jgi:ABC-type lipoprotein release transport system permease subunit
MRFELSVCLRYLAPKRGRLFVSVSTLFSILGLAVGVTTYITVLAVMTGFRNQITSAYTGYYSDLIAYKEKVERERRVFDVVRERDLDVIERAAQQIDGIKATSPFIYGKVNVHVDNLVYAFDLRGVDPERERQVSAILSENKLLEGDFDFIRRDNRVPIVIGKQIADKGNLRLDDGVMISSTTAGTLGEQRTSFLAYVAGIFAYGNIEQDLSVYTSLETAQILLGLGGSVHRVSIKLDDPERAEAIKPQLAAAIEELHKRDLLDDYQLTIETAIEQLDDSADALAGKADRLRRLAAEADLDEEQAQRAEALAALLDELPGKLAQAKGPLQTALGLDRAFSLNETGPVTAAADAAEAVDERVAEAVSLAAMLSPTLDEAEPLWAELGAIDELLGGLDHALRRAGSYCRQMVFEPFVAVTWGELSPEFFSMVNQERVITALFVALIVVVAGFIIISSLSMTVVQKKREIGILRAMGARASSVATIFGLSGFVIGLIGTALGTLFGLLISYNFNPIRDWLSVALGVPPLFSPYPQIPISVQIVDLLVIWAFALVWSVLASIVPALSAARLRPAQALRWE